MNSRFQQPRLAALAIVLSSAASVLVADQPYLNLARQLAGRYVGIAGPGNNLRIVVQPGRPLQEQQHLTVTVQGKYNGSNVRFEGLLALQPQGQTVRLIWSGRRSDCQVDIH